MKPYQERLITMLKDTITLLCRNGLEYEQEFSVEGLLGVTLDKNDVFLVPIKELITDKGAAAAAQAQANLEESQSRVSDSDGDHSTVKSERSRKRRRHRRELTQEANDDNLEESGTVFDTGPPEWDEDTTAGNRNPNVTEQSSTSLSSSTATHHRDSESPSKRPRHKIDMANIKSEDVVVIKEEMDEAEFVSGAFQDSSMDSNTQTRDGQMQDFFSQPGTSQGLGGFSLDQLQGSGGGGSGLAGDLSGMTASDGDGSWLQSPGGDMQHSQGDWQQQKHQCKTCGKEFTQRCSLRRHIIGVHNKVRYICDVCGMSFSYETHVKRHKRKCHPGHPLKGSYPDKQHDNTSSDTGTPKARKCSKCGKQFKQRCSLWRHIAGVHNKLRHICDICGVSVSYRSHLIRHKKKCHPDAVL